MPNHFKKPNRTVVQAATARDPVTEVTAQPLGLIDKWKLRSAKSQAKYDVEKQYIDAVRDQALATVDLVAALHGSECRLAEMSSHATVIAALADEMLTAQQVTATTLGANRFVGSVVNINGRQEMLASIQKLIAEGELSTADVAALEATAHDLHQQIEARIDDNYSATADMVNETFRKATVVAERPLTRKI